MTHIVKNLQVSSVCRDEDGPYLSASLTAWIRVVCHENLAASRNCMKINIWLNRWLLISTVLILMYFNLLLEGYLICGLAKIFGYSISAWNLNENSAIRLGYSFLGCNFSDFHNLLLSTMLLLKTVWTLLVSVVYPSYP